MSSTALVPTSEVEGNITSCGIDTKPISVERHGAFSLTENTTYRSYNMCSQEVVKEYSTQTITGFGAFTGFVLLIVVLVVLFALALSSD